MIYNNCSIREFNMKKDKKYWKLIWQKAIDARFATQDFGEKNYFAGLEQTAQEVLEAMGETKWRPVTPKNF